LALLGLLIDDSDRPRAGSGYPLFAQADAGRATTGAATTTTKTFGVAAD
jgi:hypothetical protein